MWNSLSYFILKFRLSLIIVIGMVTLFMAYKAQQIEWSYNLANVVPANDPDLIYLNEFRELFGEDGNIMAIGIKDSAVYSLENFRRFRFLADELGRLQGVTHVLGLPNLQMLHKDTESQSFKLVEMFPSLPETQQELDEKLDEIFKLKFYTGQLVNERNGATLLIVNLDKQVINSEDRNELVLDIVRAGELFEQVTGIDAHFAGLPYVRTTNMIKVKAELNKFLILSIIITGLVLFAFFRSLKAVFFPLIIIGIIIVWVLGTLALFGYEVTILTGLIPSIIVVIGIPNSVYMLNRYHQEYAKTGDQMASLRVIIRKIGLVTFITNFTTAIGFGVLYATEISILKEFGVIASVNVMATFLVSIILVPVFYSYVAPPSVRHLQHLDFKILGWIIEKLDHIVSHYRKIVFLTTGVIVFLAAIGLSQIKALSYMTDDLPDKSPLKLDLMFFEENFSGIMPLEMIVDTGAKKGVQNLKNLRKIDELEKFIDSIPYISKPVSIVSFTKAARQAFYNNSPAYYDLPTNRDVGFILKYLRDGGDNQNLYKTFVDSTGQKMRISMKVADIGSVEMSRLVHDVIEPKIAEIFEDEKMRVDITGTTLLFIKGNKFLIENLITSMIIAFVAIAAIMALLFRNLKMITISLIPNMIPLLVTAGIMGYFGIPLKPSTALTFSIAFGISVDNSIHFLAKYRQELFANKFLVPVAISKSLKETGLSMIYTSIILFCGFVIFGASEFGGTVALGKLTSLTLLFAMLTNLTLLPALLLQFDSGKRNVNKHPLIEQLGESENGESSKPEEDATQKKSKK